MSVIGNISSQIDSLREACCGNMFSSYMVDVNEEYVKDRCFFLLIFEKNAEKVSDRRIFVVPKSKIRILEKVKKG